MSIWFMPVKSVIPAAIGLSSEDNVEFSLVRDFDRDSYYLESDIDKTNMKEYGWIKIGPTTLTRWSE